MPSANSTEANSPASGLSAAAACAEVRISCTPSACSVAAVVAMIASATRLETAMPIRVSARMRSIAEAPWRGALRSACRSGCARMSSHSCAACQKNKYGLIVVPSTATTVVQNSESAEKLGTSTPRASSSQSSLTVSRAAKYANSDRVIHLRNGA